MTTPWRVVPARTRRDVVLQLVAVAIGLSALFAFPVIAEERSVSGRLEYRGFTADTTVLQNNPNAAAVETSLKHQIDIVADSGVNPEILAFFRSQEITLKPGLASHGNFNANSKGVSIEDTVEAAEKPVLLHELLHAFHFRVLPGGFKNPDVLMYYDRAVRGRVYPENEYVLKNHKEFFAVTASLYLWGNVDRAPHTREALKAAQPIYYAWLGQLFGVAK